MRAALPLPLFTLLFGILSCSEDVTRRAPWEVTEQDMSLSDASLREELDLSVPVDAAQPVRDLNMTDLFDTCPLEIETPCETDTRDYGECGELLGVRFDGVACQEVRGCACEGEACPAFSSLEQCALTCSQRGHRNEERFGSGIARITQCTPELCVDGITVCQESEENPEALLSSVLPHYGQVECHRDGNRKQDCSWWGSPLTCGEEDWCCLIPPSPSFIQDGYSADLYGVSLLPGVISLGCVNLE